jgi:hypothetical protein
MNRERAETYLRLLAESELRRMTALPAGQPREPRLALVTKALRAAGVIDAGSAEQVGAELDLAIAARPGLSPGVRLGRLTQVQVFPASGSDARSLASPAPPWRVVPVGQVIRGNGLPGDPLLLAYVQTPAGSRFTMAIGMASLHVVPRQLTATDDRGTSYQLHFTGGLTTGVLELRPDPPRGIRWLDLMTASGEPAIRIDLDPPDLPDPPDPPGPHGPLPDIAVTRTATSPGEILLDVIAARILTSTGRSISPSKPEHRDADTTDLRTFVADGPGNVTAALLATGALPPTSPIPGQLAALCERLSIPGHGITARPAVDLPQRWQSMLTRHRRTPRPYQAPGSWATAVAVLPELDGVQITVLGLYEDEPGTMLHILASGVSLEDDWSYARGVRPLPALWIRDSFGHWHVTRTSGTTPWQDTSMVMMWLAIVPPLEAGAAWIDVLAIAPSAEVRARLPLRWQR